MDESKERIRALCLLSGGLDSQLAVCVLRDQQIDVQAVTFESPFFSADRARTAATQLGVVSHVIDFTPDIVGILKDPPHGFGSQLNPCIDCHTRMILKAGQLMEDEGLHFLATGEVLNQRPMSQNKESLAVVGKDSGYGGRLVRPLSAQLLPETEPERNGWVARDKLLRLEGRNRKPQLQLAAHYGLTNFPSPAGGCLLTEPNFCTRLRDLMEHGGLNGRRNIELLRTGRHIRLSPSTKLVVGRNEKDNAMLEGTAELYELLIKTEGVPGPTGLLPFTATEDEIRLGAAVCARYSDAPTGESIVVRIRSSRGTRRLDVVPSTAEETDKLRI